MEVPDPGVLVNVTDPGGSEGAAKVNWAFRVPIDRWIAVIPARRHRSHPTIAHTTTPTTIRTIPVLAVSRRSRRCSAAGRPQCGQNSSPDTSVLQVGQGLGGMVWRRVAPR